MDIWKHHRDEWRVDQREGRRLRQYWIMPQGQYLLRGPLSPFQVAVPVNPALVRRE